MNLKSIEWTPELVEEWFCIAAKVERALPPVYRKGPSGRRWQFVREWYELLWDKDDDDGREPPFNPTNEQVGMWEEIVLRWWRLIDSDISKKVLWLRARGMGWARIGKKLGFSRQTIAARHKTALEELAYALVAFYH